MVLATAAKQRSAYLLRTRAEEERIRFSPYDFVNKGKEKQIVEKRPRKLLVRRPPRKMRLEESDEDEDDETEEEPQPVVRTKTMSKRGRATTSRASRRGK